MKGFLTMVSVMHGIQMLKALVRSGQCWKTRTFNKVAIFSKFYGVNAKLVTLKMTNVSLHARDRCKFQAKQ